MRSDRSSNLIIFGFTGDLSKRKLLPALYHLIQDELLDDHLEIIGVVRREVDMGDFRNELENFIHGCDNGQCNDEALDNLMSRISLVNMQVTESDSYKILLDSLKDKDSQCSVGHTRLYYFAVPPEIFPEIISAMIDSGIHSSTDAKSRLLIEKPFGSDYGSASQLCEIISNDFEEEDIYRIDHYLAKDTVQNILHIRFSNPLFKNSWNVDSIESIVVTAFESIDIQGRVNFYEKTGATRDMIQSHLLQVLALLTMEQPKELTPDLIRKNRFEMLRSLHVLAKNGVERGQYEGYREEVGNPESNVETYVKLPLISSNSRWSSPTRDVDLTLRAGKALDRKETSAVIKFYETESSSINTLRIDIQPEEGFSLEIETREPGLDSHGDKTQSLIYKYDQTEEEKHSAYEKILIDAIVGDQTLFPSSKEVLNNWSLIDPILNRWKSDGSETLQTYRKGDRLD